MPLIASIPLSLGFGFLCGSVPFGYLAGRLNHIDVRTRGSGNIGFTNVLRVLNVKWAIPVLILDILKGLLPAAFAPALGLTPALAGAGAILGHVFTPWLGFRGGKGVATAIGVSAFLCIRSLGIDLAVYALVLLATGFVSLSSIVFGLLLVPLTAILYPGDAPLLAFSILVGLLLLVRHRSNVGRLIRHEEPRFGPWLKLFRKQRQ